MKKTSGHWGLSGPGWAAEWNMGGESEFLSIATGADDDKAVATMSIEVPVAGRYFVWVRYGDWREQAERFQVRIEQSGRQPWTGRYGERAIVEEDNEMKLYWDWVFAWDQQPATLQKGSARLSLISTSKERQPRQVDVIVLTTDPNYRPLIKERPRNHTWEILESYRRAIPDALEPLARNRPGANLPAQRKLRTFRDKGFVYPWNVSHTRPEETWLGDQPNRVKVPYNLIDKEARQEFEDRYGGRDDVPIFSDRRIVPTFHGVGPGIFATDADTGELSEAGKRFAAWLDANPERCWAMTQDLVSVHGRFVDVLS